MFTDGRRLIAAAGLAGALCLALAAPVVAQQQAPAPALGTATGKVTGKLLEKGKDPIAYANVIVLGTKNGTMTDESGTYVLTGVPVGAAQIQVQATGYDKQVQTVQVNAGATSVLNFDFGQQKIKAGLDAAFLDRKSVV